jgi:hypothetical protein
MLSNQHMIKLLTGSHHLSYPEKLLKLPTATHFLIGAMTSAVKARNDHHPRITANSQIERSNDTPEVNTECILFCIEHAIIGCAIQFSTE